jgi:hypothetical protein
VTIKKSRKIRDSNYRERTALSPHALRFEQALAVEFRRGGSDPEFWFLMVTIGGGGRRSLRRRTSNSLISRRPALRADGHNCPAVRPDVCAICRNSPAERAQNPHLEDTTGPRHAARALGDEDWLAVVIAQSLCPNQFPNGERPGHSL